MSQTTQEQIGEMLQVNKDQKHYYEVATGANTSEENSTATNLWRKLRRSAFDTLDSVDVQSDLKSRIREWVGDVSDMKVLDLGMGEGNPLSFDFAKEARDYVAIDLSETRVQSFEGKLRAAGIESGRVIAADFLAPSFEEDMSFDLIYAMSVMHHFQHLDAFLDVMHKRLAPGGLVVTLDPIETWLPIRILRAAYRPFQTDKAWEFPFKRKHDPNAQQVFRDRESTRHLPTKQMGGIRRSAFKKTMPCEKFKSGIEKTGNATRSLEDIYSCLRVAFALRRRDSILAK